MSLSMPLKRAFILSMVMSASLCFARNKKSDQVAPLPEELPAPQQISLEPNATTGNFLTCNSFEVFQKSVTYLKEQKELPFTMPQIFTAALEISKGCTGADKRFRRIFEMLTKSGVDTKKCYDLALDFSKMTDQKTDNFMVLFKGLFLENKFDLDFMTAYKISLQLSAALPGNWKKVRTDFEGFLNYCTQSKNLDLPIGLCAQWALHLMKHEDKFPQGIFPSFEKINGYLTSKKGPQLSVKDRLNLVSEILEYGPKAPENFQKAMDWMNTMNGEGADPGKSHRFALQIAKNSLAVEVETETEKAAKK